MNRVSTGQGEFLATPVYPVKKFLDVGAEMSSAAFDLTADPPETRYSDLITSTDKKSDSSLGIVDTLELFGDACNGVSVMFYGTDGENETAGFDLLAFKRTPETMYGRMVYTTDTGLLLGTRVCDLDPIDGSAIASGLWADTLSGTNYWDDAVVTNSANDDIVSLDFDLKGHSILYLRTHNVGGGSEMASLGAIITGW